MATGMRKFVTGILRAAHVCSSYPWAFLQKSAGKSACATKGVWGLDWAALVDRICAILDGNWRERAALRFVDYPQTAC